MSLRLYCSQASITTWYLPGGNVAASGVVVRATSRQPSFAPWSENGGASGRDRSKTIAGAPSGELSTMSNDLNASLSFAGSGGGATLVPAFEASQSVFSFEMRSLILGRSGELGSCATKRSKVSMARA